jgi:hypothetical protein
MSRATRFFCLRMRERCQTSRVSHRRERVLQNGCMLVILNFCLSARMLLDLEEKDYGGKAFPCTDPEGHVWHVGSYDPRESQPT